MWPKEKFKCDEKNNAHFSTNFIVDELDELQGQGCMFKSTCKDLEDIRVDMWYDKLNDDASYDPKEEEIKSVQTMIRGVYLKKGIKKGTRIFKEDVYFAIPLLEGQMESGSWKAGIVTDRDYNKD